ncbi:hypothetical protein CALVIDRAFT_479636 [Calocera viscosa TUFC12733]|uniref:DNA endonuclease activator Ctp1 C-terminal domain-containing protein n=1 Tax=Calocera viscosa (strain TUFC12733) TaxID=1330018 RepID=A0A167NHP7_CALVF|nr:hypothetical protein CALVIDRAFT_479636 [Calocera viscosa TUFC12733]
MIDEPEAEADRTLVDVKGKGKASASPRTNQQPARALTGSRTSTPVSNLPTDREGRATALRYLNKLPNDQYADQYKAFKGHGRYSGNLPKTGEEGINTRFEIDKDKNNGMDYQYDSVVRNKETRRHMHGADCECCRDYYEAVGPLPLRLQPPLWKSPSPRKKRKLAISPPGPAALSHQNGETRAAEAVQSHKQEVSRHRQAWMRSNTPPDYWNIGFPTTQQVRAINRKAEEMHREKDREIELEAERGGRYKRRS